MPGCYPATTKHPSSSARRRTHRHNRQTSRSTQPQPKACCRVCLTASASPRCLDPSARLMGRSHPPSRQRTRHQSHGHLPAGARSRTGRNAQPEDRTPTGGNEYPTPNPSYTKTKNQYSLAQHQLPSHSKSRLHDRRRLSRRGQHQHRTSKLLPLAKA